jgi:kynurenine 3-monooxygenase
VKGNIAIVGAGLVGSLLAIYLAKRGYAVSVFERRSDMRHPGGNEGRSINLALSNRGLRALNEVGLAEKMRAVAIPMHGRTIHDIKGNLSFLPYGEKGQFINSISRRELNIVLMTEAENLGASIKFGQKVHHVDLERSQLEIHDTAAVAQSLSFDHIIGADGAFSAVRSIMQVTERYDYQQEFIDHGYKELTIPAGKENSFQLEKNSLHIWPRESYMLIALPNPDGSFTCTLFFPFEGQPSFKSLDSDASIYKFFVETFPDATRLIPDLVTAFQKNPTGSLVTIKCNPWSRGNTLLIGDAAHAIVPFYGQGMNAGFEDCRVLNLLLDTYKDDWAKAVTEFQRTRKPDCDAIAQLALDNFIEMRDLVGTPDFLLRKKIESRLHELYPNRWVPLYSMVTFHDEMRYSDALSAGLAQKKIMDEVMKTPSLITEWQSLDFENIVNQLAPSSQ